MLPVSSTASSTVPAAPQVGAAAGIAPLAAADVSASTEVAAPLSAVVDLSPLAQFLSTLALSQQQVEALLAAVNQQQMQKEQAAAEARESAHAEAVANEEATTAAQAGIGAGAQGSTNSAPIQLDRTDQLSTLNDAAQHLADAFNLLQAAGDGSSGNADQTLLNNLVHGLQQGSPTENSQTALANIGITLQPPLLGAAAGGLSLDTQALQTAFDKNPQQTLSTLNQTINSFGASGEQFAQQASGGVPLSTATAPLDNGFSQSSLSDLALQDALQAASTEAAASAAPSAQPALTADDLAAAQRLDIARAAASELADTQATRLAETKAATARQLSSSRAEGDAASARAARQAAAQLAAEQATQAARNAAAATVTPTTSATSSTPPATATQPATAAASATAAALAGSSLQLQPTQTTQIAQTQTGVVEPAQPAAKPQVLAPVSALSPSIASVSDTDQQTTTSVPSPAAPATTLAPAAASANPNAPSADLASTIADDNPLATNPELAAAIAAYRLNGDTSAAAHGRPVPLPATRPEPVAPVAPVAAVTGVAGAGVSGDHARAGRH